MICAYIGVFFYCNGWHEVDNPPPFLHFYWNRCAEIGVAKRARTPWNRIFRLHCTPRAPEWAPSFQVPMRTDRSAIWTGRHPDSGSLWRTTVIPLVARDSVFVFVVVVPYPEYHTSESREQFHCVFGRRQPTSVLSYTDYRHPLEPHFNLSPGMNAHVRKDQTVSRQSGLTFATVVACHTTVECNQEWNMISTRRYCSRLPCSWPKSLVHCFVTSSHGFTSFPVSQRTSGCSSTTTSRFVVCQLYMYLLAA